MEINLSDILSVPAKEFNSVIPIEADSFDIRGTKCPIISKSDVSIQIVHKEKQKLDLHASFQLDLEVLCDRCLTPTKHHFDVTVERELDFTEGTSGKEKIDDDSYIEGSILDIDMLVYEEIFVRLPMKNLCNENCKGICWKCGANLNLGDCGCKRKIPDPRMSKVLDIFNNFKEV